MFLSLLGIDSFLDIVPRVAYNYEVEISGGSANCMNFAIIPLRKGGKQFPYYNLAWQYFNGRLVCALVHRWKFVKISYASIL